MSALLTSTRSPRFTRYPLATQLPFILKWICRVRLMRGLEPWNFSYWDNTIWGQEGRDGIYKYLSCLSNFELIKDNSIIARHSLHTSALLSALAFAFPFDSVNLDSDNVSFFKIISRTWPIISRVFKCFTCRLQWNLQWNVQWNLYEVESEKSMAHSL